MHPNSMLLPRRTAALLVLGLAAATTLSSVPVARAQQQERVVVASLAHDVAAAAAAVRAAGGQVLDRLSLVGGVAATLPAGTVLAPGYRVVADRPLHVASTEDSSDAPTAPADTVRGTLGLGAPAGEGAGVTVAVVDTGVAAVADLAGRVEHVNVTGDQVGDGYGHGTFVAGLIAGSGAASGGANAGVAPGASLLDVRVADGEGNTSLVDVLKGLQVVAAHPLVRVVNLSLSSGSPLPYQIDPLAAALEALWRRGVTVVVPAGNAGPDPRTITSPGSDPVLLTVGGLDEAGTAAHSDDTVAPWSSRGPAFEGVAKPDLVAPAAHVISLRAPGSVVDEANPQSRIPGTDGSYFRGSGTSFGTAVTSGAVAALLAQRPSLTPDQVKSILENTAYQAPGLTDANAAGAGGLDLAAAYDGNPNAGRKPHPTDAAPGDPAVWAAFLDAVLSGDREAAASSWSQLSPLARNWAARNWAQLSPDARNWAARNWAARNWAGADGTFDQWAARNWAARNWAARNWADSDWAASSWSARNWAASSWSARNWAARNWVADDWAARNWAASSWSARNWAARWG